MSIRKQAFLPALVCALVAALLLVPGTALASNKTSTGLVAASTETETAEPKTSEDPQIKYRAYVGSKWTNWKSNGSAIGDKNKKFQIISLKLAKSSLSGQVKYRIYQRGKGWSKWVSNGARLGTKGWYMRGVQVRLTGKIAKSYDVVYRAYIKDTGWQPWTMNGGTAGSAGKLGQIQKLEFKLVPRGSTSSIANGAYFIATAKNPNAVIRLPGSKTSSGVQMTKAAFNDSSIDFRFFIRKQVDGSITLQSCTSGLYLCDAGGKVVQRSKDGTMSSRWTLSLRSGGCAFSNVQTGRRMKVSGGKLVTAAKGSRFALTRTDVLPNGTYTLTSIAKGNLLAVIDESLDKGAKLQVQKEEETNAEVFRFTRTATDTYRITNTGSSKRIEVASGSSAENAIVRQNASSGGNLQKWKVVLGEDGAYSLVNKASRKALTAAGAGNPGSSAVSSTDTGAATQRWKLVAQKPYKKGSERLGVAQAWNYAKSTTSYTNYLITVDLTHHWMCIVSGPKGNRTLLKSWECSTGRPRLTPTGSYTINGNTQYEFGDNYSCYYATAFIGWEYLFHSVTYQKNSRRILDGRLGQSVSSGCVRLDIDNAQWLYNSVNNGTIPVGTRVKIYY